MHAYRTHTCGALRAADVGSSVKLSGWIHRRRDHGGVMFIDLRDHYGRTQIVIEPENAHFNRLEHMRAESVLTVTGKVLARSDDTINPDMDTGEVELAVEDVQVHSEAEELPLPVFGEPDYPEETRLKFRYLDLRRDKLHANMVLRAKVIAAIRRLMGEQGFTEYQTPILTASSPEGARDFLVPSRLHPGQFYALPQAPQQFKQLLMIAGFDRYFQMAPCFRDEDPRADRSPGEFYQLDLEMSFVTQEDVFAVGEPVIRGVFEEFGGGRPVTKELPRIPYKEALLKYGSDKPDLRNPIEMQVVSEHFAGSNFKIFAKIAETDGQEIRAIPAPSGGSRAFCDRMDKWAQKEGLPGMAYIFWREGENGLEGSGPVAKNIGPERTNALREQLGLKAGDAAFFVAGKPGDFQAVAGRARDIIGQELKLTDLERFELAWIVDFPIYEWDEDEKRWDFEHNPFSMPQGGAEALDGDPGDVLGYQYDMVCNGYELASGAIRNHLPEIMYKAFAIAGYDQDTVESQFGGMLSAFRYGAPPHGGMAAGVERIVMLLADEVAIREVMPFPMNQQAQDLMMNAPSEVDAAQLKELNLRLIPQATETKNN